MPEKIPRFSYSDYEQAIRGPYYETTLRRVGVETADLLSGCRRVLDVGSGQGLQLNALRERCVPALGVDNNAVLVNDCRTRGLSVIEADALPFLAETEERFDGCCCAHLLEHLSYETALDLLEGLRRVLEPGGRLVLRWPNPRSAATQLLSFWKDPTHIRFYDGELIEAILQFYGFEIVQAHYDTILPRPGRPPASARPSSRLRGLALRAYHWSQDETRRRHPIFGPVVRKMLGTAAQRRQAAWARLVTRLPGDALLVARRGQ